jgi:2-methylcitrate dehydratase PrpD
LTLSTQLVRLIRNKPVTDADLGKATLFVLDALANAYAGRVTDSAQKIMRWYAGQGGDAGRQALTIGALTHMLETDDLHRASVTHPGCVIVPAALAVAAREGSDASLFLTSVLHGFEACCRIGNAVGPAHYQIWHNTATCGPYGSAMATACLLSLDDGLVVHALGNAGTQSSGLWQFLATGAMSKHLHAGRAAEAGIVAADLAAYGFTGPPAILEGEKGFFAAACPDAAPDAVLSAPDEPWQLCQTSIKPWPSCRHTHPVIDAALELHESLQGADIDRVEIEVYQAALDVCDRRHPDSEYAAKFSLHHCVSAALIDGTVGFDSFTAEKRNQLQDCRCKVSCTVSQPFDADYPGHWGGRVTVTSVDGHRFSASRRDCKGDPELPLSDEEMIKKADGLLRWSGLGAKRSSERVGTILALAEGKAEPGLFAHIIDELLPGTLS